MLSYYHRIQIDEGTLPGVFYDFIHELQAAPVQACPELLNDKLIEACMADPLKPAAELIPNITDVIDYFIALIRAGSHPPDYLLLKCDC